MLELRGRIAIGRGERNGPMEIAERLEEAADKGEFYLARIGIFYLELDMPEKAAYWFERSYQERSSYLTGDYRITLPEDLPDHPALRKAFDKPGLNALFELRRKHLELK